MFPRYILFHVDPQNKQPHLSALFLVHCRKTISYRPRAPLFMEREEFVYSVHNTSSSLSSFEHLWRFQSDSPFFALQIEFQQTHVLPLRSVSSFAWLFHIPSHVCKPHDGSNSFHKSFIVHSSPQQWSQIETINRTNRLHTSFIYFG